MDHLNQLTQPPAPRLLSIILVFGTIVSHGFSEITHAQFNMWLTTGIGICALVSYGHTFYKWHKKRKQDKIIQDNLKKKSGGHR